ncbi:MAG TPA: SufD family Fe-S cluster assembly protein [Thermoplasmata archaeon]|nr:SufD family Fe-S cluster assembly protein [Thermoplasmata archaeon]
MASAVPRFDQWLSAEQVHRLSQSVADPAGFVATREDAFERFQRLPIEPNPLFRGYGYFTNVDLSEINPEERAAPVALPPPLPGAIRIVFDASGTRVDLPPELAAAGVRVRTLAETWTAGDPGLDVFLRGAEEPTDKLSALSTALLNRGYRLEIPDGYSAPVRVQDLTVLSAPHEAISVRRSIRTGKGTQLLVTEELYSAPGAPPSQRLYASSVDLDLGERAKAIYLGVHAPDLRAVSIYRRTATTGDDSRLAWLWNGFGGFRTKIRNRTALTGRGSHVDDLQTFLGAKDQAFDSSVDFTHISTDTHAQSITRGVFRDSSRGMSRGLVRIEPNANKTVVFISEHAMLLSPGARSDTIPILEILCRDVKATHSTSVAPVDPEKVFYLESRGMNASDAVRMIGEGYLSYVLDRAPIGSLRDLLYPSLAARWDGQEIVWDPSAFPALPTLEVTGSESAPEWRFDAKLR